MENVKEVLNFIVGIILIIGVVVVANGSNDKIMSCEGNLCYEKSNRNRF